MAEQLSTYTADDAAYAYFVDDSGCACISSCEARATALDVPERIEGHPVARIGQSAFAKLSNVAFIRLPESVHAIGWHAFEQCHSLRAIVFPKSLDAFDGGWLIGCKELRDITLPGMAETAPRCLFNEFNIRDLALGPAARHIELPRGKKIELDSITIDAANRWLKSDGTGLYGEGGTTLITLFRDVARYVIAPDCRRIAPYAFAYHEELSNVSLPGGLEEIGNLAFLNCGITEFAAPAELKRIGSRAFMSCAALCTVKLNDELEEIGESAFARTPALTELSIPPSVYGLGPSFAGTPEELVRNGTTVVLASDNPHLSMDEQGLIYRHDQRGFVLMDASCFTGEAALPLEGTVEIADDAFRHHHFAKRIRIPEGVVRVGTSAFRECAQLADAELPSTLEEIGEAAFFGTSLESVSIPATCVHIGERALDTTARRQILTCGSQNEVMYAVMQQVRVDADNPVYYVSNGLLCRRRENGEAVAVLYVGPDEDVTVPDEVTTFDAFAFSGVTRVRRLRMHSRIRALGAAALFPTIPFERVEIGLDEPECGQHIVGVNLPTGQLGLNIIRNAFYHYVDARLLMKCYDASVPHHPDHFERYKRMIERLANPQFLADWARAVYLRDLGHDPVYVCTVFARKNYLAGLDALVEFGIADAGMLTAAVDKLAGNPTTVTAVARLIELRRLHFGVPAQDYSL